MHVSILSRTYASSCTCGSIRCSLRWPPWACNPECQIGQLLRAGFPDTGQADDPARKRSVGGSFTEPPGKPDSEGYGRSPVHGVAWTAGVKRVILLMSWGATVVVARALAPDDFGLLAVATVFTCLVVMISDFGTGQAVIKRRELTGHQVSQIYGLCVLPTSSAG